MNPAYRKFVICMLLGCMTAVTGCASSPQSRFYTLTAMAPQASGTVDNSAPSIAIASVTIPELVDRPQMVIRDEGARVDLLETHRWAEPLKSSIPRTIAENISRILGINMVSSYPQNASLAADIKIYLDLQRFESAGKQVTVDALWTIRRSDGRQTISGRSQRSETAGNNGYDDIVSAYSRGLESISRDIALALKSTLSIK